MIEGASIDKQAHAQDAERAIWDTIEFDRAVGVAKRFAEETNSDSDPNNDTLVVVTADHETSGFSLIGVRNPDPRIPRGSRDTVRACLFTNACGCNGIWFAAFHVAVTRFTQRGNVVNIDAKLQHLTWLYFPRVDAARVAVEKCRRQESS